MNFQSIIPKNFDAVLITSDVNRRYFGGEFWDDGYFIITEKSAYICSDARCFEIMEKANINPNINLLLIESYRNFLTDFFKTEKIKRVVCEGNIPVNQLNNLNNNSDGIFFGVDKDFDKALQNLRRKKTPEEVENIKKAQNISEEALSKVINRIRPGITEWEFALELEFEMRKSGSKGVAFDTIAVSGKNTSMPHGVPSQKVIETGDFLTVDFGAVVNGYRSDMTRTFVFGNYSPQQLKAYYIVLETQAMAIKEIKAGMKCKDADKICRDIFEKYGFGEYFTHSTGHGVGLDIHEFPNLSPLSESVLEVGDVITVEPGLYFKNLFGIRIEDMLYISENGTVNLTHFKKAPENMIIDWI